MYLVTTLVFFLIGGLMALIIRLQLASDNGKVVSPENYDRLFTMHGTTMIFLFVVPVMAAFGNYFVPLQIGARDMAFPKMNAASYWLFLFGGLGMYSSFVFGGAPDAGWTVLPAAVGDLRRARHRLLDRRPARDRHLLADRRDQLHLHHPQHAGAGDAADPDAAVHLDDRRLLRDDPGRRAGAGRRADDAAARPQLRHAFLHPAATAATPCSGSTCSGSTATPSST